MLVVKRISLTSAGEKSAIANNAHILNNAHNLIMNNLWVALAFMLKLGPACSLLGAQFLPVELQVHALSNTRVQ